MVFRSPLSFGRREAQALLPVVSTQDNKSSRGRALIIAGSRTYPGAGILCGRAALRSGCGYVLIGQIQPTALSCENPDFLVFDLEQSDITTMNFQAAAIGPGSGVTATVSRCLQGLYNREVKSVVVDADALTLLAEDPALRCHPTWILTPHEGELSRLMKVSVEEIRQNRLEWARRAQKKWKALVLLKGHETLIASEDNVLKIEAGNPALAKAGTGDVLTGIICSFLAQGLGALEAASLGAYIHGFAADLWVLGERDPLSFMASDLIEFLPRTLYHLRKGM